MGSRRSGTLGSYPPTPGEYLLSTVGFLHDTPLITLEQRPSFVSFLPLGQPLSWSFDTRQRYCTGWSDISKGERYVCPDTSKILAKYEQCPPCQARTGFNPAFYNAKSVSTQQQARNQQPHTLYLARFAQGLIKVGITHAKRATTRLLEQGARDGLILGTFKTADQARQYEAKIAALPGITETVQLQKKLQLMIQPYDHDAGQKELVAVCKTIETALHIHFEADRPQSLDHHYFSEEQVITQAIDCTAQGRISGHVIGMLGTVLFCRYQDELVYFSLKKYTGYKVTVHMADIRLELPVRQTSLF